MKRFYCSGCDKELRLVKEGEKVYCGMTDDIATVIAKESEE